VDFKETAIALDPNHEASIFADNGKATESDMLVCIKKYCNLPT
jgi:hypothetical protein